MKKLILLAILFGLCQCSISQAMNNEEIFYLEKLPKGVFVKIFSYLKRKDLGLMMKVNKSIKKKIESYNHEIHIATGIDIKKEIEIQKVKTKKKRRKEIKKIFSPITDFYCFSIMKCCGDCLKDCFCTCELCECVVECCASCGSCLKDCFCTCGLCE